MRTKKVKRFAAVLIAATMVLALFGCGKKGSASFEKSKDPVTLTYYYNNGAGVQTDTEAVQNKLNELLKSMDGYEHITLQLMPFDVSGYQRGVTLAQSTGEQIDIINTYGLDYQTAVANGDYYELDELMKGFPDMTKDMPEWVVDYGKLNGKQYYIPTYQQAANLTFIVLPEEYLEAYLEYNSTTKEETRELIANGEAEDKLTFLEDLCNAVRESTGSDTKWINPGEFWGTNLLSNVFYNQEYLYDQFGNWILREDAEAPEYFGTTDEAKEIIGQFATWYQDGLLHSECATLNYHQFTEQSFLEEESYVNMFVTETCTEEYLEEYLSKTYDIPMAAFRVTDHAYIPSQWEAGGQAIYIDSEHPYEAMMIIDLLRTEKGKEFYNTLVYGIEGTHWEFTDKENDKIKTFDYDTTQGGSSDRYCSFKWNQGDVIHYSYRNQATLDGYFEYVEKMHGSKDTVFSPAMGITWDFSEVSTQMAQCSAVEKEFSYSSIYTAKDWEKRFDSYVSKMQSSGLEDILDSLVEQYEEHLKSKK